MYKRIATAIAAVAFLGQTATAQNVDIELSLLIDVSGSVDGTEYLLQKTGYVNAFNNGALWAQFEASGRSLAVSYSEWSSSALARTGWVQINNATDAANFATTLNGLTRANTVGTQTWIGNAINFGVADLGSNSYTGTRRIIDVSGDGCDNGFGFGGDNPATATAAAAAANITINGLAIGAGVDACYANYVTGDGFVESAASFADFDDAIVRKIGREIGVDVPEPSTFALLGLGLFGLVSASRRRRA